MPCNEAVVFFARDLSAANLHFKLALKGPFELSYESWLVVAVVVIVELEVVEADGPVDVFQSPTDLDGEVFRFLRWHLSRQTRKGWGSSWCKVMGARTLGGNRKGNRHSNARVLAPSFELKFFENLCLAFAYSWKLQVLINNAIVSFDRSYQFLIRAMQIMLVVRIFRCKTVVKCETFLQKLLGVIH